MKQYIENLPPDLEEAARADGAGEFGILWNVIIPLAKPAIAVLIINTAIINWNAFLFPLIFTDTAELRTLPVALSMLAQGQYGTDWGALMAGSSVSSLPIIIIFCIFQKEIIEGITSGALKDWLKLRIYNAKGECIISWLTTYCIHICILNCFYV